MPDIRPHPGSRWTAAAVTEVLDAQRANRPVKPPSISEPDWDDVVRATIRHRVHVLLAPHLSELGVPEPTAGRLSQAHRRTFQSGMAEVRDTVAVSTFLDDAGIDHLIVKGAAFSWTVGELPAQRGGGDVDVWVRPFDVARAERLAREHGWQRRPSAERLPEPGDGWRWRTFLRLTYEHALDHPELTTLDLHWRLARHQPELGFDFADAWERSVAVPVLGPAARTLCPDDAFVHIAQHGRKEAWPTLRHLVDVARIAETIGPHRTRALARQHQNVALALTVSARVAPWLAELVDPGHRRVDALADEAWQGCLSLQYRLATRRNLPARSARRIRAQHESWVLRSAPDWATRLMGMVSLAIPVRLLIDPRLPTAYPRRKRR
jgi:hypothetical protein